MKKINEFLINTQGIMMARNFFSLSPRQVGMILNAIRKEKTYQKKHNEKINKAQQALQRSQDYLLLNNEVLATERFGGIDRNVVCPSCNPYYVKMKWSPPKVRTKIFKLGMLERFFKGKETETKATCTLCLSQWILPEQNNLESTKKQISTKEDRDKLKKAIKEQATLEAMERKKRLAIRDAKWKAEAKKLDDGSLKTVDKND